MTIEKIRMAALQAEATHTIFAVTLNGETFHTIRDVDSASDEELRLGTWVKVIQPRGLRGGANQADLLEATK